MQPYFELNKPLPKPADCKETWDTMTPCNGGRICGQCNKVVVDFRRNTWHEIESKQRTSPEPLCGFYTTKQMKYWGKQAPIFDIEKQSFIKYTSVLFAFLQLLPNRIIAQTNKFISTEKHSEQRVSKPMGNHHKQRKIIGTLSYYNKSPIELNMVNIGIQLNNFGLQTIVNTDGSFEIDISDIYEELKDTLILKVEGIKIVPRKIYLKKENLRNKINEIGTYEIQNFRIEMSGTFNKNQIQYYGIRGGNRKPLLLDTINKIKSIIKK